MARDGGEEAAAAMAYTAVARVGGAKAYPSVDKEGMGIYYDAAQLSDTVEAMRRRHMSKVSLPNAAIEGNDVPPHLDTYLKQLPAQFPPRYHAPHRPGGKRTGGASGHVHPRGIQAEGRRKARHR